MSKTPHAPGRRRLLRGAVALTALPALGYTAAVGYLWQEQESLLFHPQPLAPDFRFDQPGITEVQVPVPGGQLDALHLKQPNSRGLVFFLHGNAGNLQTWTDNLELWRRTGYDLFVMDYRGFGKSSGRITSEAQMHDDVRRAWDYIAPQYAGRKVVIYGRSLGTGLATYLARDVHADLLLLVSPYASLERIAAERYPWVPSAALRYPMHTDQWLPQVRSPVWIVHGTRDEVIPYQHAQTLQSLRPGTELMLLPDTNHHEVHLRQTYVQALLSRMAAL